MNSLKAVANLVFSWPNQKFIFGWSTYRFSNGCSKKKCSCVIKL